MDVLDIHELKLVAVTGGGSGIGRALCQNLAEAGLDVVALGRSLGSLEETAKGHARITPKALDVRNPAACDQVFGEIAAEFGQPVDALVASAAIYPREHFLDQSAQNFEDTMLTNIIGVANAVRAVLPDMLARNMGRVCVIGSLADQNPIPTAVAYSASKGALHALVRGIAAEVDRDHYPNVLVNEFMPSATKTAMSEFGQTPQEVAPLIKRLLDFPSGGPHGTCWAGERQIYFGEGLKGMLLRKLKLRK